MAQKGFEYEKNVYNILSEYNISTGSIAGASYDRPDLMVKIGNESAGVELKNQPTAAGSLVLQYYDDEWHFGPTDNNPEKEFLKSVGEDVKIIEYLNKNWKSPSLRYEGKKKYYFGFPDYRKAYQYDLKKFGNVYVDVPNSIISEYYQKKNSPYLNVGNKGFFIFDSDNDPLNLQKKARDNNLPKIPIFSNTNSANTKIRVRVQDKSGGYQFSFTLQFDKVIKSPYNLGPLRNGSSSNIDENSLKENPIVLLFEH
jgi:hypothetical protein